MAERDDVILEKINSIQRCLATIDKATKGNPNALDDVIIEDAVTLNIQRAAQLCIDIAYYVISLLDLTMPSKFKDSFIRLQEHKIIDETLAEKMCNMVGFRNIAVHDYQELDKKILKSIVSKELGDFEEFYTKILNYLDQLKE